MNTNNLNCIIIHGCPSDEEREKDPKTRTYDTHWYAWIKKELTSKGIKTYTPLMPNPWHADYRSFKRKFEEYEVNENTILIGHSCGGTFLVRWLGETKKKISKLILVAPWKVALTSPKYELEFYQVAIDKTIPARVKEIIMFTADNEEPAGKEGLKMFHDILGGKIISLQNHGHYCLGDMGTEKFPELLNVILNEQSLTFP